MEAAGGKQPEGGGANGNKAEGGQGTTMRKTSATEAASRTPDGQDHAEARRQGKGAVWSKTGR